MTDSRPAGGEPGVEESLREENLALQIRLAELEDTLDAIRQGDVDALVVNDDIYTLESALAATNRLRQNVLDQMEDTVFAFDLDDHIIFINKAAERQYGVVGAQVLGRPKTDVFIEIMGTGGEPSVFGAFADGDERAAIQRIHRLSGGREIFVEPVVSALRGVAGEVVGSLAVFRDVSDRRRAEARREALAMLTDVLRDQDDAAQIAMLASSALGEALGATRTGYGSVDAASGTLVTAKGWTAVGAAQIAAPVDLAHLGSCAAGLEQNRAAVVSDVRVDGRLADPRGAEASFGRAFVLTPLIEQGRLVSVMFVVDAARREWSSDELAFIDDVADRTHAVTEKARNAAALRHSERRLRETNENLEATVAERTQDLMVAEEALRQAQKMEAVGQLTGGIAHDFNNILAAISASLQVLQTRLRRGKLDDIERYIAMGQDSVRRAAALTQRLLAFARRQTLDPKPTDVNRLVKGMEDLIRRTGGPTVRLEIVEANPAWLTRIDAPQLENALLNLCINARDAMLPDGGRMTIATANHRLDAAAAAEHDLPPGEYVSLAVTDQGTGMSPEVIERIFDPFFTTKPLGQGTGLGLSMVYGFVRQSGGQIHVASEPGKGTMMSLYLPRHLGLADPDDVAPAQDVSNDGRGETVVVIEDEDHIRSLLDEVLRDAGYRSITAADGPSGLRLMQSGQQVDLLITDVGLPGGLNGRQIADLARVLRPGLKVLFITGYAENAVLGDGNLEPGMEVLTKPFEIAGLARKVKKMLG